MLVRWSELSKLVKWGPENDLPHALLPYDSRGIYSREELEILADMLRERVPWTHDYFRKREELIEELSMYRALSRWRANKSFLFRSYWAALAPLIWTVMYRVPMEDVPMYIAPSEKFQQALKTSLLADRDTVPEILLCVCRWRMTIGR